MPDTQKEFQSGEGVALSTMWFETHMGARYELPDMLRSHISAAHADLDWSKGNVTATNVSEVVLVLPKRIIKRAGVGDRCFWEV